MARSGYSGTPLAKKLGIKPGATLYLDGAPRDYPSAGATRARSISDRVDLVHLFTKSAAIRREHRDRSPSLVRR